MEIPFTFNQISYLPAEGVGLNGGSFTVKGSAKIDQASNSIVVEVLGSTPASQTGDVEFFGNASVCPPGAQVTTEPLVQTSTGLIERGWAYVGSATFALPEVPRFDLRLEVGYTYRAPEGTAIPIPLLRREISIRNPFESLQLP